MGAQKGQLWLQRNHHRLLIAVRAHLGASLNFQAGTVKRAPQIFRKIGIEWLWRIKEEPYLWRRYWNDGKALIRLLVTRVIPLAFWTWWVRTKFARRNDDLIVTTSTCGHDFVTVSLSGSATARCVHKVIPVLRKAIATNKKITLDFSNIRAIDARFLGLLLMLSKKQKSTGVIVVYAGLIPRLSKIFNLNGFDVQSTSPNASEAKQCNIGPRENIG